MKNKLTTFFHAAAGSVRPHAVKSISLMGKGCADAFAALEVVTGSSARGDEIRATPGFRPGTLGAYRAIVRALPKPNADANPISALTAKCGNAWRAFFSHRIEDHPEFARTTLANALLLGLPRIEAAAAASNPGKAKVDRQGPATASPVRPAIVAASVPSAMPSAAPVSFNAPAPTLSREARELAAINAEFSARVRSKIPAESAPTSDAHEKTRAAFSRDAARIQATDRGQSL